MAFGRLPTAGPSIAVSARPRWRIRPPLCGRTRKTVGFVRNDCCEVPGTSGINPENSGLTILEELGPARFAELGRCAITLAASRLSGLELCSGGVCNRR